MNRVISADETRKRALELGATVTVEGKKFNRSQAVAQRKPLRTKPVTSIETPAPQAEPAPAPTPAPPPVVVAPPASVINVDTTAIATAIADALKAQEPTVIQAEAKPTEWAFTVERDERGLIQTINAKAK